MKAVPEGLCCRDCVWCEPLPEHLARNVPEPERDTFDLGVCRVRSPAQGQWCVVIRDQDWCGELLRRDEEVSR